LNKHKGESMKVTNIVVTTSILTTILLSGCSTKNNKYVLFQDKPQTVQTVMDSRDAASADIYESKVIPNNRLSVLVFNHPELSTRDVRAQVDPRQERGVLVAQDGTVNLPLIGVVRVSGLTSREVANLLTREYSRYIKHSHVTVDLLNKRVFVMGEVHRLENEGKIPVVLIEAQVGEYTGEDDIVRLEDDFKRH